MANVTGGVVNKASTVHVASASSADTADADMSPVPEADAMKSSGVDTPEEGGAEKPSAPSQEKKESMSYLMARKAGLIKCRCKWPICPSCVKCLRCTCLCPDNTRRKRGKKKSSGRGVGSLESGGSGGEIKAAPKKKLRVAEIAAIEAQEQILSRLRRTDRTVLVPVAADGTDAYTASCITDVLARFGATLTVAKVPECSFDMEMPSSSQSMAATTGTRINSTPRDGGASPTRRSAASASAATASPAAVSDLVCKTSEGGSARIVADMTIQDASTMDWDMIVLPGGVVGCKHLRSSELLMSMLKRHRASLKLYGAIGEAPAIVLASAKPHLLALVDEGRGAACLPDPVLRSMLPAPTKGGVVLQGNLVTAVGPGSALDFAVALGKQLYGPDRAKEIAKQLLVGSIEKAGEAGSPLQEVKRKGNNEMPSSNQRQGQDDDDSVSKDKNCVLSEEDTFMQLVWPTLDTLGWSLENMPTGDGTVFCPPGVKRDAKGFALLKERESSGDDGDCDDDNIYCLQTKMEVVNFVQRRPISHSSAQYPVLLFTQCMDRADDLVAMGRLAPADVTLASVLSEVKRNGNIAEVPLFDEFIWPRLHTLGWSIEEETRHRPKSYVEPSSSSKGDRFKPEFFAPTRKDLVDFLYEDDVWGSKDEVLKVLDVFQACVSVGNEMASMGLLINKMTPLWLYLKARERRPALPWLSTHLGPQKEKAEGHKFADNVQIEGEQFADNGEGGKEEDKCAENEQEGESKKPAVDHGQECVEEKEDKGPKSGGLAVAESPPMETGDDGSHGVESETMVEVESNQNCSAGNSSDPNSAGVYSHGKSTTSM